MSFPTQFKRRAVALAGRGGLFHFTCRKSPDAGVFARYASS